MKSGKIEPSGYPEERMGPEQQTARSPSRAVIGLFSGSVNGFYSGRITGAGLMRVLRRG